VVVVLDVDGCRFGVVVDAVHDTEEIVVKPLGRQLGNLPTYAGATILGDGQIALILDPVVLAREAHIEQREALAAQDAALVAVRPSSGSGHLLVVQVSPEVRAAVPLECVKRLEELSPADVERVGDSPVIQYRGSILQLIDLAAVLGAKGEPWRSGHVVVVSDGQELVGLQVQEILDISSELSARKPVQGKPGITSYGVIQGKVIAVLDIAHVLSHGAAAGEFWQAEEAAVQ